MNTLRSNDVYNIQVYDFATLNTRLELSHEVENMVNVVIVLVSFEKKYCIIKRDINTIFSHMNLTFASTEKISNKQISSKSL